MLALVPSMGPPGMIPAPSQVSRPTMRNRACARLEREPAGPSSLRPAFVASVAREADPQDRVPCARPSSHQSRKRRTRRTEFLAPGLRRISRARGGPAGPSSLRPAFVASVAREADPQDRVPCARPSSHQSRDLFPARYALMLALVPSTGPPGTIPAPSQVLRPALRNSASARLERGPTGHDPGALSGLSTCPAQQR